MTRLHTPAAWYRQFQIIGSKKQGIKPIIAIGKTTLWRWVSEGKFPKPYKLSDRVTAWKGEEIDAWMAGQKPTK